MRRWSIEEESRGEQRNRENGEEGEGRAAGDLIPR
jgi:hypothetical protein